MIGNIYTTKGASRGMISILITKGSMGNHDRNINILWFLFLLYSEAWTNLELELSNVDNRLLTFYWTQENASISTWGSSCCGQSCDLFRPRPGFDPLCARLSPPRCLTCSWACRMFSGPWGIVVVRVSWPGHPT